MKIGFNCSSFHLFHAGHVTMLKMEKEFSEAHVIDKYLAALSEIKPNP